MLDLIAPTTKADYPAYSVAYTGTAGSTTAWNPGPQGVVIWSDQACYVEIGVGAVATTASCAIPANQAFAFAVPLNTSGAPWRVSAIQVSTGGTVYAKPINKA